MATVLTGIAYPLQIDPATGGLLVASDEELISGHVRSVLETEPGENPMRPDYGTPGQLFTTQPNFAAVAADVQRRLTREIPQATFSVNGQIADDGEGLLTVAWAVNGINQETFEVRAVV